MLVFQVNHSNIKNDQLLAFEPCGKGFLMPGTTSQLSGILSTISRQNLIPKNTGSPEYIVLLCLLLIQ